MKQKITFLLLFTCMLYVNAQTQFWSDTFEDTGAPSTGTRTPSLNQGGPSVPYAYYFLRTDGSDIALQPFVFPETFNSYQNIQGSKFWAGEDTDRVGTGSNNSNDKVQNITWTGINISGKSGLTFRGLFAANNGHDWQNLNHGSTYDFIEVEYSIDGGAWILAGGIYPNTSNGSGGRMSEDTNGDKIGDGTLLSRTFQEFNWNIMGTGTTMDLRFRVSADAGATQEFAIDNFRLFEAPSCTDPTVPTVTATANPVCNGASTTLNITGTLNDATQWAIYTGSCGGSLLGTTASSTFAVTPSGSSTTYYIRGEGGCVTPGTCATITINVNPALTASISSQTNVACNGGTNGAATVTPTGGTGPFSYSWSPSGITTATATGLAAGTYNVMVTDANNCSASTSVTITEPTTLALTPSSQTDVSCNSGSNGAASVNVATGGAGGYTYNWTPGNPTGDGTPSVTGLSAGTWTCTVTDANSCTTSVNFTITQPTALALTASSQTNVSCNGGIDGAASVNVATGGAGSYTYNWTPGNPTGDGTPTITGLTAGTWTCTVTDLNSCSTSVSFTITEPTALIASASVDNNASCNGEADGAATASASGGTAPYTYLWSNSATTASITGVSAGTYTVTITDDNGCTNTASVTITEPSALIASASVDNNVSCNGEADGAATASASGGTAPYTYLWSSGATTASITDLNAGIYIVTITDNNGCTNTASVTITEPSALIASASVDNNASCNGEADGAATASASGGTAPYTYLWSSGATTASITGLNAGIYIVTITDNNGCTNTASVTITEPSAINSTISELTTGILTANEAGATYQWYECPNTLLTGETNQDFTPTVVGDYKVEVTVGTCTVESACYTVNTLGSNIFENKSKFSIYPNPNNGQLNINADFDGQFIIVNQVGQTVKSFRVNSNIENTINVENLSDGIYFIKGTNGTEISSQKLIIKK